MSNSYYYNNEQQARPIQGLVDAFTICGNQGLSAAYSEEISFTAGEWKAENEKEQQEILMNYRIIYFGEAMVNWCQALGTVLTNDEATDGASERSSFPIVRKKMHQWCLRVPAYAQRLLDKPGTIDWTESLKKTQKSQIGRSESTGVQLRIKDSDLEFTIFTTRADTTLGVTFMVLTPESDLVTQLTTPVQKAEVDAYLNHIKKRMEHERIIGRSATGVFSSSYAINPFTGEAVPIWVGDYVLAGYGTGTIMAIPAYGSRDYVFAKYFGFRIHPLVEGCDVGEESFDAKGGIACDSSYPDVTPYCDLSLNGLTVKEAIEKIKQYVKEHNLGRVKASYHLHDVIFSRQRYWGKPFPVYHKDGMPYTIDGDCLLSELPEVDRPLPTGTGEPSLGHAKKWAWDTINECTVESEKTDNVTIFPLELNTTPGSVGSSAYYLRYMDPHNNKVLADPEVDEYWKNVDLYIGGTEHATGYLIYSRFWNKFLRNVSAPVVEEPPQKLVNQGIIQDCSNSVYRIKDTHTFVSLNLRDQYEVTPLHVDINTVSNDVLDLETLKAWRLEYVEAEFIFEDGKYICGWAVEKMSESVFDIINPDMIVEKCDTDTFRMYEMFLGSAEQSKSQDTSGIDGVRRPIRKFRSLFYSRTDEYLVKDEPATKEELKNLHKLIKEVTGDIERFSYNTSVSVFAICINELSSLKCDEREVLEQLVITLAPSAPHVCEELWGMLGHETSVRDATWPVYSEEYLEEDMINYTVSFSGRARFNMELDVNAASDAIQAVVLADERSQKWIEGKTLKKIIVVPEKTVGVVV